MYLYSTLFVVPHTQGAKVWITQCYLQLHQCLPLPSKHWPDGAFYPSRLRTSNCSLLLIYLPRKDERLSRPGWLIYNGRRRFTHISGHPSAAGRAQGRESSTVKDQWSTTVPRNKPVFISFVVFLSKVKCTLPRVDWYLLCPASASMSACLFDRLNPARPWCKFTGCAFKRGYFKHEIYVATACCFRSPGFVNLACLLRRL